MSILDELVPLAPATLEPAIEGSVQVSLIIPARNCAETLESTVKEADEFLRKRYPDSYEIILVPNSATEDSGQTLEAAEELGRKFSAIRICPHLSPPGKGAAVRTGFLHSKGNWIFLTDADLPYDLDFFDRAREKLASGYDLVTGNRRLPSSHFDIPVTLLPLAYGRHRLGLWFNRLVRFIFPITTTDTQAGIKALSRRLALQVFGRQICPGFLFDLEIFLTAHGHGYQQSDLPVTLHLNSEKTTVRILRECLMVANWLIRISIAVFQKRYHYPPLGDQQILSRYRHAPLVTRLFLWARWKLTPYRQMASRLPVKGEILDLGCGHGLFALAAAVHSPSRQILGLDHDQERIRLASGAAESLPNVRLEAGRIPPQSADLTTRFSGIAMIDVMHYFDLQTQEDLVKQAYGWMEKGGVLLVREVDPSAGVISSWNRFYEKVATTVGLTRSQQKELFFRSRIGWEELMRRQGFEVRSERCSSFLFADVLFICERR